MEPFLRLASAFDQATVRFVVIGVAGANHYARSAGSIFTTEDFDLFLATHEEALRELMKKEPR